MRRLFLIVALAALLCGRPVVALADCPDDVADCQARHEATVDAVPTVDPDGEPIPYVEEVDAPPAGLALVAEDPH